MSKLQSSTGKVIPFGYTAGGITELERLMQDERTMLIDIRLSPRSGYLPAMNRDRLQSHFQRRYIHMPELGNLNYRPEDRHKGITIADPGKGIARLVNGLNQGYTFVLMCACQNEGCHRWTVIDLLKQAMPGVEIVLPDTIKCLSIQQPWAWLICHPEVLIECGLPVKNIENRRWTTAYRGPLLIHTGLHVDKDLFSKGRLDESYWSYKFGDSGTNLYARMPQREEDYRRGAIVGFARLTNVIRQSDSEWFIGRYGLVLLEAYAIETPIPYSGALKIFDIPRSVIAEVSYA